ncbi:MAG TPA: efflux transporter outer membrane subunit [Candidatus Sulfotelmatobacter sp.]|nr:efflux transporter outer membrane subunit [Candidatus Sulfotelmatobacter sp.]
MFLDAMKMSATINECANQNLRVSSVGSLLTAAAIFLLLPGCAVGPNYQRPRVSAPTEYRSAEASAQQASIADLPWWEVFKDQRLRELVQTALANNYDLRIAITRIEQSRQIAAQARAQYFPFLNYGVTASDGKNEFVGGVAPNEGQTRGAFVAAASAAWEADLWGRIRRENEAARAQYLATEQARRAIMLSLVSDVAQAYFELLDLDLQLDIAKQTTESFSQTVSLFTHRLEGGVASKLDTSRAEAAYATAAASIPELERQIALKENQISVLLGNNPSPVSHSAKLLDQVVPPDIPSGLPSTLLERRPDILVAEEQLRSANAQVGVATANFFPRIGLTALFGRASSPLDSLSSGQATVWSIAGNIAGPIYQGGALRAQKRQAVAFWEQSKLQYEQTAQIAFQDVSNALVSRMKYEAIRAEQARAVQAYQESVKVSLQRYIAGKASYFEVLDAQLQLYPAENALAFTELNRRTVVVQLYKALGGGWNLKDPEWIGPKS